MNPKTLTLREVFVCMETVDVHNRYRQNTIAYGVRCQFRKYTLGFINRFGMPTVCTTLEEAIKFFESEGVNYVDTI